jgi:exopolyphosphatase / guanosine-5'-triphosphate,3'-diphosphate pyrophosphatase
MTDAVAIIDCGTNTIRLLITEPDGAGGLSEIDRRTKIVRLGQGVDASGEFHADALARTFAATDEYASVIKEAGVPTDRIRFIATSATRDVRNRDEFFAGIRERVGVTPDVITGDEEAALSFAGALSGARDPHTPTLVTDIGGGSTELIIGNADGASDHAVSIDIGSVRITERFFSADPPTGEDIGRAGGYIDGLLDDQPFDWPGVRTWIGVAGTLTTLAAIDLDLTSYDRSRVHGHKIAITAMGTIFDRLSSMSADQIRKLGTVHPDRADVITGGALIGTRIADRLAVDELIVSETDILDGAATELIRQRADR